MIRTLITILLFLSILTACEEQKSERFTDIKKEEPRVEADTSKLYKCACADIAYISRSRAELRFHGEEEISESEAFQKWSHDSLRLSVKVIELGRRGAVPSELVVFENVERVAIFGGNGEALKGFDIFPNLRMLELQDADVQIDGSKNWVKNIEVLLARKSTIEGLDSLSAFSKLKTLELAFSKFTDLAMDIDNLKCLQNLILDAYVGDTIELKNIDLEKMPCLKKLHIHDAFGSLKGMPTNLMKSKLERVHVYNIFMSPENKALIKKYKHLKK